MSEEREVTEEAEWVKARFDHDFNNPRPSAVLREGDLVVLYDDDDPDDLIERPARITGFRRCRGMTDPAKCVVIEMEWVQTPKEQP